MDARNLHFIGLRRTGRGGSQTPGRGGAVKLRGQTTSFIIDVNDRGERSELSGAVKNQSQSRSRADGRVYSITNLYQPKPRERLFFLRSKLAKVQPLKALPPFGKLPHNFTAPSASIFHRINLQGVCVKLFIIFLCVKRMWYKYIVNRRKEYFLIS